MSYQVDQVEIAPVTSAPERKRPGNSMGLLAEISKVFNGQVAPATQELILEAADKPEWNEYTALEALRQLSEPLSVEQFFELAEKSSWNTNFIYEALRKLDEHLSIDQFIEITEKSDWKSYIATQALRKLDEHLSIDQFIEITEKSDWRKHIALEALKKLDEHFSIDQFLEIAEKSSWNTKFIYEALKKFDGALSFEQVMQITEKSSWDHYVAAEALTRIDGAISLEQLLEITEKSGQDYNVVHEAFRKVDDTLSFEQILIISEKSGWNSNLVYEALKKLSEQLSAEQLLEIARQSNWNGRIVYEASEKFGGTFSFEQILEIIKVRTVDESVIAKLLKMFLQSKNVNTANFAQLSDRLLSTGHYYSLLVNLENLENFENIDTTKIASTLIENGNYGLVVDHLSHFPQKDWAQIIKLLTKDNRFHHQYLTLLLPYIDYIDQQTKKDIFSKLLQSPDTAFFPELLENEIPRAAGQFGSFKKEDQRNKLAQLKEGRFYKALLVLSKAYGYSAEQIGFTFEGILSEINNLISNNNDKHLFDLISLALHLFPEKEIELQNIRETFSTENSSPTEEMKPRETFVQFDALKEIFEYYAMLTLAGRHTIDLLPHSLTSKITDKINTLYEKIKEYIVIAVSSELEHSSDFKSRMFGNHGNFLYKFGTPEDIRVFFERAESNFPIASKYPARVYGGPSWATIADFGAQFWADSAQNDLSTKITLLNLAVSLQHNNGYFFDKDNRIKIENQELRKLLDFEAGGERTFESFLAYGLENHVITQEEYAEYVQLNNTLSSATDQLTTRVDSNKIYLKQMVQEAKKQIEAIQNNPAIPFEIKMEAQAVFSKTEGFSRKENYRLYLSNLLKTISVNWENIDDTIKRFQSGNQVIYSVSIAGYDLAYWYEDGKLITIHSMDELKQQRQKLSQLLNQPIVAAQFGYVREGD